MGVAGGNGPLWRVVEDAIAVEVKEEKDVLLPRLYRCSRRTLDIESWTKEIFPLTTIHSFGLRLARFRKSRNKSR